MWVVNTRPPAVLLFIDWIHVIMMSLMNVTREIGLLKVMSVMVSTDVETTLTNRTVVSTNGYISMGERVATNSPEIPGTRPIVAPYAANINPILAGTVQYTQFTSTNYTQMSRVSTFIRNQTDNSFYGTRMMVAEWDGVAEYSGFSAITSTFQCVLITDGSASYAVFIYECGGMEWDGASIGWQATSSLYQRHHLSGSYSNEVDCEYSNSSSAIVYRLDTDSRICTGTDCSSSSISAGVVAAIVIATLVLTGAVIVVGAICIMKRKKTTAHRNDFPMSPFEPPDTKETNVIEKGVIRSQRQLPAQSRGSLQDEIEDMIVPNHRLQLGEIVGQGETGLVYRGYIDMGEGNELVAVKTGKNLLPSSNKEKLLKEISIMLSFKHPNVMSLLAVCFDGEMPLLVMPFMSSGSLLAHVKQNRERLHCAIETDDTQIKAARKDCLEKCFQVSKGMAYLAKHKFVHRDLAARNCMIARHGVIRVADFGLTEDMYSTNYYRRDKSESDEKVPIRWMAPESIEEAIYSEATDVWSFGVTCWEVFTCGRIPYTGVPALTLLKELRSGHRLSRPSNAACSDEIWNLMMACWSASPQERHRFSSIVYKTLASTR